SARLPVRQRGMQTAAGATGGRWLRPGTRLLVHRRRAPPQTLAAREAPTRAGEGRTSPPPPPGPSAALAAFALGLGSTPPSPLPHSSEGTRQSCMAPCK